MKAQSELTGDRKRRAETTRPRRKAEQQIWMPIEGTVSSLTLDTSMKKMYGHSLCGTYAADLLGTIKSEVNHCPAAQQWAGQYSVNSANLCLRGIP